MAKSKSAKKFKVGVSGTRPMRIPITNVYSGNDYTATIYIGSRNVPVNVLLDTGSSTLAVAPEAYETLHDTNLKPTSFAQIVAYGTGGWAGPLVNTGVRIGEGHDSLSLERSHVAITTVQQKGNFVGAKGILGLAYKGLNAAHDLKNVLAAKMADHSHPWPFKSTSFNSFNKSFEKLRSIHDIAEKNVEPYFTELEEQGVVANKFSFYTLRSRTHHSGSDKDATASDPLNKGFFILGGGEEQTDLYIGDEKAFLTAEVYHHLYYNTNLRSVQVEGFEPVAARPLQKKFLKDSISNSIIDTGTNTLYLAKDVYNYLRKCFKKIDPVFIELIDASDKNAKGLYAKKLDLTLWPDIHFTFSGDGKKDIKLTCKPNTYWQVGTPDHTRAVFQIGCNNEGQNQSVFGLPLMNNYYTIFDRSVHKHGVVRFAPIKYPL